MSFDSRPNVLAGPGDGAAVVEHGIEVVGRSRLWFEAHLRASKIIVDNASGLGRSLEDLRTLEEMYRTAATTRMSPEAAQRLWLSATGADFLSKALHWGNVKDLTHFERDWRLLKSGNPVLTGPSEAGHNQHRAKTWELVLASLGATFSKVAKGEPDVVCHWRDVRVGLAGKVLFTRSESAVSELIEKGIDQIQKADVTAGCVVLNMVEMFPHASMFRQFLGAQISNPSVTYEIVASWVDAFMCAYAPDWPKLFKKKSKLLAVAFFVPTVLPLYGQPVPLPYYRMHLLTAIEREKQAIAFTTDLQRAFEDVLAFDASQHAPVRAA